MQSNQYHQPQSPAYLSTINTNSGGGFSQQPQQQQGGPQGGGAGVGSGEGQAQPSLFRSVAGAIPPPQPPPVPSVAGTTDTSRYSAPGRSASSSLHEDTNNKREQRLLKNRWIHFFQIPLFNRAARFYSNLLSASLEGNEGTLALLYQGKWMWARFVLMSESLDPPLTATWTDTLLGHG